METSAVTLVLSRRSRWHVADIFVDLSGSCNEFCLLYPERGSCTSRAFLCLGLGPLDEERVLWSALDEHFILDRIVITRRKPGLERSKVWVGKAQVKGSYFPRRKRRCPGADDWRPFWGTAFPMSPHKRALRTQSSDAPRWKRGGSPFDEERGLVYYCPLESYEATASAVSSFACVNWSRQILQTLVIIGTTSRYRNVLSRLSSVLSASRTDHTRMLQCPTFERKNNYCSDIFLHSCFVALCESRHQFELPI